MSVTKAAVPGLLLSCLGFASGADDAYWPQWRGPHASGESTTAHPPLNFGEEQNLRWKVEIPGKGKASPIVWQDRVYVLTAEGTGEQQPTDEDAQAGGGEGGRGGRGGRGGGGMQRVQPNEVQRFVVMAINRKDGSLAWQAVANEKLPAEGTHGDGSWASGSCVTDGEILITHFGSQGLFGYTLDGEQVWEKQLGQMRTRNGFGEGSSPALWGDALVVQWDHEGDSFIVALDKHTGEERWRRDRDEVTSWATPVIVEVDGKPQVIASATSRVRGYDLATGDVVWECAGMTTNTIPSPIIADGIAYLVSGFRGSAALAIRLAGAKGDITGSEQVLWSFDRDTPYVPSPLLYGDRLYFLKSNTGILTCLDVKTGTPVFGPQRLETIGNIYASPVAAAGRIYLCSRDGDVEVLAAGDEYKVLAKCHLDEGFDASPAIVDGEIYLRGQTHLYCFAEAAPVADDAGG